MAKKRKRKETKKRKAAPRKRKRAAPVKHPRRRVIKKKPARKRRNKSSGGFGNIGKMVIPALVGFGIGKLLNSSTS